MMSTTGGGGRECRSRCGPVVGRRDGERTKGSPTKGFQSIRELKPSGLAVIFVRFYNRGFFRAFTIRCNIVIGPLCSAIRIRF